MATRLAQEHVDVAAACAGCARIGAAMSLGFSAGRRHLVEQRLEQVVVVPVEERDVRRRVPRPRAAYRPPKPPPMMTMRGAGRRAPGAENFCVRCPATATDILHGAEAGRELSDDPAHVREELGVENHPLQDKICRKVSGSASSPGVSPRSMASRARS